MIDLAILAAGKGTRLFGPGGGCKPLARISNDIRIIDYMCNEMSGYPGLGEILVVESPANTSVSDRVRQLTGGAVTSIAANPEGTGYAISRALDRSHEQYVVVATADIFGPPNEVRGFVDKALLDQRLRSDNALCIIATVAVDPVDEAPIFVHCSDQGNVQEYGKTVAPSGLAFASVRIMNSKFAGLLAQNRSLKTDTEMMRQVLKSNPGSIRAINCNGLFDIDDMTTLTRASTIIREHPTR